MKYNNGITKPVIYTLLVLGILVFSKYPESCAKYATYDETALTLNAGQYKLEKTNVLTISPDFSDPKEITKPAFILSFPRNKEVGSFSQDTYTLSLPKTCEIYGDISTSTTATKNKVNKTITFNHSNDDTIVVKIKCDIDQVITGTGDARRLDVPVSVQEQFVSLSGYAEKSFTYTSNRYNNMTYAEYASEFDIKQPTESNKKTIRNNDPNAYVIFEDWLKAYYKNDTTNQIKVLDYIQKYCKTTDKPFFLAGLDVTYDAVTDSYTYTIGENFTKYAGLYYSGETGLFKYFLPADDKELENAFEFYLQNDIYKDELDTAAEIASYVKSSSKDGRGIGAMILPDADGNLQEIYGLRKDTDTSNLAISVLPTIKDYIYNSNKENKKIRISFDMEGNMRRVFLDSLSLQYEDSIISKELIQEIDDIYVSIVQYAYKNNTDETPVKFDRYFVVYDNQNHANILIRIYSNPTDDTGTVIEECNYVEVMVLDSTNVPSNQQVMIMVKKEDKEKLLDAVKILSGNTEETVDESKIIESAGILAYFYKTPKTLSTPSTTPGQTQPGIMDDTIVSEITTKPSTSTKPTTSTEITVNKAPEESNSNNQKVEDDTPVTDTPEEPIPTETPKEEFAEKPKTPIEEEKKEETPVATEPPKEEPVVTATPKPTEEPKIETPNPSTDNNLEEEPTEKKNIEGQSKEENAEEVENKVEE